MVSATARTTGKVDGGSTTATSSTLSPGPSRAVPPSAGFVAARSASGNGARRHGLRVAAGPIAPRRPR